MTVGANTRGRNENPAPGGAGNTLVSGPKDG